MSDKRKISIHQLPKSPDYLQHWVARPGCVWVQSDIASLEQVVLAELSEDRELMKLYGGMLHLQDICGRLTELGIRFTVVGDVLEIVDEDMHKLQASKK